MRRRRPPRPPRPPLSVPQILAWADSHHAQTGEWPKASSGHVLDDLNEKWVNVDQCLRKGLRGPGGKDSLARLLDRERGVRNVQDLSELAEDQVVARALGLPPGFS